MTSPSISTPASPKKKWWRVIFSFFNPLFLLLFISFCVWLIWKSLTPTLPSNGAPPKFYSNQCRQDLTLTMLEALRSSKSSIDLIMFGLSDPTLLKELNRKGKKGIKTTVHYDISGSPNLRYLLPHCELHPIHQSGLMHQKFLIIDEAMVFLGSANMTTQSLQMHDNLVIGLYSKKIASFLKEKGGKTSGHLSTFVGGEQVDLWLLPDQKGHALQELKSKLHHARHSIKAALFTLTHPILVDELIRAHKRGVKVTVVIDMHTGLGASNKSIQELRKQGIKVLFSQGVQLLHHKFVYIDDQTLITGSANWTKAAFTKNNDCLFMIHYLKANQKEFLNYLWKRLTYTAKEPIAFAGSL